MALKHTLILLGTARQDGNTALAAERLRTQLRPEEADMLDVAALALDGFRYGGRGDRDRFRAAVSEMPRYRHIVFATPVYWYAMSGVLKTFVDRLTDLLQAPDKDLGRALAGRDAWLLSTGTDPRLPAGFTEPFVRTSRYFGLNWRGGCYVRSIGGAHPAEDQLAKVAALAAKLKAAARD